MARKSGLGKGLDALIPTGEETPGESGVLLASVDEIRPNPRQPRAKTDGLALRELAASIQRHGLLQPLLVVRDDDGKGYTLIAGERRLRAAKLAGLREVPVVVRQANEQATLELALIENLQRSDLNALEAAQGYRDLAQDFGLTHEQIALSVGKSRTSVTNTLRLLKLSAEVRQALTDERISEGHARALLGLKRADAQSSVMQVVIERGLNVRQTEELVQRMEAKPKKGKAKAERAPEETDLEERLRQFLGTRVSLKRGRKGGRVVIHFYSDEELNALVDRLLGEA